MKVRTDPVTITVLEAAGTTINAGRRMELDVLLAPAVDVVIDRAMAARAVAKIREAAYELLPNVEPFVMLRDGNEIEFDRGQAIEVVDCYMRIATGQWDAIPFACGWVDKPGERWTSWDGRWWLNHIRASVAHHPFDWPNCSQSIAQTPNPIRRAYNVWKLLGGGVDDRYRLPVDPPMVWDVLDG